MGRDRKYTLTHVRKGDYLLLSNDGLTLWRICTYDEDGSAVTSDGRTVRGRYWGVWKYKRDVQRVIGDGQEAIDPHEWHEWNDFEMWEALLKTRREGIEWALAQGEIQAQK